MIGYTVIVDIKSRFYNTIIISDTIIVVIIIKVNGNTVTIGISQRIYSTTFQNIRNTIVVIIDIICIIYTVVVIIKIIRIIEIIRNTIHIGIDGIFGFEVTVRVGIFIGCQNTIVVIVYIEIVRNTVTVGIVVLRVAVLRIIVGKCHVFKNGIDAITVIIRI